MIAAEVSTPGVVIVNGPQRIDEYRRMRLPQSWVMIELPENIGICGGLNHAFRRFPFEKWYGLVCDDELVFTKGFDKTLIDAAGRWGVAHGNDGWRAAYRLWTYVVYPGDLLRTVGYWSPPGLFHWYFDDTWEEIAREFGLKRFCQDVKTEHEHTDNGKVSIDETYAVGRSRADHDKARFERWKSEEWPTIRERLKLAMQSEPSPAVQRQPEPVGTKLAAIFAKCGIVHPKDCDCTKWMNQMDQWGIAGCQQHRAEILQRLKTAASGVSWLDMARVAISGYLTTESLLDAAINASAIAE